MRLYRALLHLYPSSFWAEYREELCYAFAERTRGLSGPLAWILILWAALTDVIPNAIAAHWDVLRQDLVYAARSLRRTPGFALTAVLVVALGVGANTAVFSLADFVFVRPLPYQDADRLVRLWQHTPGYDTMEPSPANYRDWKAMTTSFSQMGAYASWEVNLVDAGEPSRIEVLGTTQEVLPMLGVAPLFGRIFTAQDAENVLLLSHGLWQSQLGGDPHVLGRTVRIDGVPYTVLGVMPASFQFPSRSVGAWRPLVFGEDDYAERSNNYLEVLARLRPGVSKEQAFQDLAVVSSRLERQYPKDNKDVGATVLGLRDDLSDAGSRSALDALRNGTRAGGGRTQRLRAALVVVEVAASVVLLITSGLLIRAVWRVQAMDPGFIAKNVLTLRTALPVSKYDSPAKRVQYHRRVVEEVSALPGVRSAAFATGLPLAMRGRIWPVSLTGEEVVRESDNTVSLRFVTPRYFETLGIPLRRGRDVAESDTDGQPKVAVVSESFAQRHWPNQDPLGKRFNVAFSDRTVVGVVGNVLVRGLERQSEPQVYLPYQQQGDSLLGYAPQDLALRTADRLDVGTLLPRIREIVKAADAEQPISNIRTMEAIVAEDTASRVTQLRLLGALSAVALLIAGLGIHGLLTFAVSKRSQELGVRRALGAQAGEIIGLVLREGLVLALIGIGIGVAVAWAAARGMSALLFGVSPEDPLTIAVAAALCLATAVVGCLRPALRAARVDPLSALRAE